MIGIAQFQPSGDDDDIESMVEEVFSLGDNDGKLAWLKGLGFPDHGLIEVALQDNNWDVNDAYWVLIRDLVDKNEHYFKSEEVKLHEQSYCYSHISKANVISLKTIVKT